MTQLTKEEIDKLWNEETYQVQQGHTMLSWEACEMIAWNRIAERIGYENLDLEIPKKG